MNFINIFFDKLKITILVMVMIYFLLVIEILNPVQLVTSSAIWQSKYYGLSLERLSRLDSRFFPLI